MDKAQLMKRFPHQIAFFADVGEDECEEAAYKAVSQLEGVISMFFFENFGVSSDGQAKEGFKVGRLALLPREKKLQLQDLVQELVGYHACLDYFCGGEHGVRRTASRCGR